MADQQQPTSCESPPNPLVENHYDNIIKGQLTQLPEQTHKAKQDRIFVTVSVVLGSEPEEFVGQPRRETRA